MRHRAAKPESKARRAKITASRHVAVDAVLANTASVSPSSISVHKLRRPSALVASLAAKRKSSKSKPSAGGFAAGDADSNLLSDDELSDIEARFADGITAVQVVELFAARQIRFSEATFRKYVQQGLLPRSRRIGRKGKHRGSMGVYPAKIVRRVNAIKMHMAQGYTIEQIQNEFLRFADVIEALEEGIHDIFTRLESEVAAPQFDNKSRRSLEREIADSRRVADDLLRRLDGLTQKVARAHDDQHRSTGAAGSAEDLL